jgi:hypothetical protein
MKILLVIVGLLMLGMGPLAIAGVFLILLAIAAGD